MTRPKPGHPKPGLGSASEETKRRVGRAGAEALHRQGKAHRFTSESARSARRKQLSRRPTSAFDSEGEVKPLDPPRNGWRLLDEEGEEDEA